ncbi:amidotransferase [Methylophaga sp. SB9B]|nr:amidotransferase [Methylophaga sp. SB9B]
MQAHYFQHVAFEGLGSIDVWLKSNGYQISSTQFYQQTDLPEVGAVDFLVVMGGPMSVNDEAQYPWLAAEKQFIQQFIATGKPLLGICLGAQLIANAMGGRVYPNKEKEIGWWPIQAVSNNNALAFQFPETASVFHWHGETFDLPEGAERIAESYGCRNQAFQLGNSVIGLQFHLETTPDSVQALVEHCADELQPALYVQSATEILSVDVHNYHAINQLMNAVLQYLHTAQHELKN